VPIAGSDIVKRLSVTAAAGDTTAGTPATSLGDQVSTTVITDATIENLFDNVSAAEATAGMTDYRCFFVLNNHATLTYTDAEVSVQSQTASGASVTIALDDVAISAKGAVVAQAAAIASSTDAPSGVGVFGAGPLSIGSLAPGQVKAVWVKRITPGGSSAQNPDGAVIRFSGETLP
jgi:hypothetical protein